MKVDDQGRVMEWKSAEQPDPEKRPRLVVVEFDETHDEATRARVMSRLQRLRFD